MNWLQCYSNPTMTNLVDHDGRTMWFKVTDSYVIVDDNNGTMMKMTPAVVTIIREMMMTAIRLTINVDNDAGVLIN